MFKRLAAYIFVIVVSRTYGQFQLSFGTPTPQAPLIYDPSKCLLFKYAILYQLFVMLRVHTKVK